MQNDYSVSPLIKDESRTIFMTGGSSGIGFQAALEFLKLGHKLILPCRDLDRSKETFHKFECYFKNFKDLSKSLKLPIMDLSNLESINTQINKIYQEDQIIDILILNAGLQYTGSSKPRWSKQGIELTFAVNHLAHHYLTSRLLPLILKAKEPRIIITSSEVHNPKSSGGRVGKAASLGSLKGLKSGKGFEMVDGTIFNADKAYKDSKLCNLLFSKELYSRLANINKSCSVIAWAPGLVIPREKDGFFRYSRKYNEFGQRLFAFIARDLFKISTTVQQAGVHLKYITIDNVEGGKFIYFSNKLISPGNFSFEISETSSEVYIKGLSSDLWKFSDLLIEQLI